MKLQRQLNNGLIGITAICLMAGFIRILRLDWIGLFDLYPDDAYYYLQIGWNWSKTGFVSFDGSHATNGFHPLWGGIVALLGKFSSSKDQLVLLTRLVEVIIHLGIGWIATSVPGVRRENRWLVFAIGVSCLAVQNVAHQGMESGIYTFTLLGFLVSFSKVVTGQFEGASLPMRSYFVCGLWATAAILSRVDASLLIVIISVLGAVWTRNRSFFPKRIRHAVAFLFPFGLVGAWMLFSKNHVGSYLMDSALSKKVFAAYEHDSEGMAHRLKYMLGVAGIRGLLQPFLLTAAPASLVLVLGWKKFEKAVDSKLTLNLGVLFVASNFVMFLLVGYMSSHIQWWYIASGTACALFWVSQSVGRLRLDEKLQPLGYAGAIICSAFFAVRNVHNYPIQRFAIPQAVKSNQSMPEGSTLGFYDSGAIGFYTQGRTVVNMDGLVNSVVRKHLQDGTYSDVLDDLKLDYLCQHPSEMFQELGAKNFKLEPFKNPAGETVFRVLP